MKGQLHLILSTDATVSDIERYGMLPWNRAMLDAYREAFDIDMYSADTRDFSRLLGVRHHPCCPASMRLLPKRLRQAVFYLALLSKARKMKGVIRTLSPNLAILPEIRRLSGSPVIVDFHYDWSEKTQADYGGAKSRIAPWFQRRCMSAADLVIASTADLRQRARREFPDRVIHIPNFVDRRVFHPSEKREPRIVFAGRLHWAKGCDVLMRAFNLLAPDHRDVELVILGTGEEEQRIRGMLTPEMEGRVRMLGSVPHTELATLVGGARIFAFPTVTVEGQPKALIEAMACGTPCVCSDVPGVKGLIRDCDNGLLVPPSDPAALARAFDRLLADEVLWRRLSESCLRGASRFDGRHLLKRQIRVMRLCGERARGKQAPGRHLQRAAIPC